MKISSPLKFLCPEVDQLLSHLTEESWTEALKSHVVSPSFARLSQFVSSQRAKATVYPPPEDTFSALNYLPLGKVRIVIVGQDPYHQPNQGHGLAFSVRKGVKIPPSLRNIFKELTNDGKLDNFQSRTPTHGFLERWARQGVLMLNNVLTVRKGEANSHAKKGWEEFTDEVIRVLDLNNQREENKGGKGLIFLLWGKPASRKAESIISKSRGTHTVICTSHPSPLGATKTKSPFLGSGCFSRANDALTKRGMEPIDWNIDGDLNQKSTLLVNAKGKNSAETTNADEQEEPCRIEV